MVIVVDCQNRDRYARELELMFRDRKTVFIDMSGWELTADGPYERDQFDTDAAVYHIVTDSQSGRHLASLRLVPTTQPTLLSTVFPQLCEGPPPSSKDIWEVTRICFAPDLRGSARHDAFKQIALAGAEFGLACGIRHYSVMAYLSFVPAVLSLGWASTPLGMPQKVDHREPVSAFKVAINAATLRKFRKQWSVNAPVLQLENDKAA